MPVLLRLKKQKNGCMLLFTESSWGGVGQCYKSCWSGRDSAICATVTVLSRVVLNWEEIRDSRLIACTFPLKFDVSSSLGCHIMFFMSSDLSRGLRLPQLGIMQLTRYYLVYILQLGHNSEIEEDFGDVSCHKSIALNQFCLVKERAIHVRGNMIWGTHLEAKPAIHSEKYLPPPLE